jgi:putative ABC transport system substrate-binding protein
MITRRRLLATFAGAAAVPLTTLAQQPSRLARIGTLYPGGSASGSATRVDVLRAGLRNFGYVEGRNITIESRWAEGKYDRLAEVAADLVRSQVDVIVTSGTPAVRAAKQATSMIPIVMTVAGDAVASGLIASLARPGGNITGTTYFDPELHAKRLELLKETVPRITRVGILLNPDNPQSVGTTLQRLRLTAELLKLELPLFEARSPNQFEGAFSAMAKQRVDAVEIVDDGMFLSNLRTIANLAATTRLPSTGALEFAEAGGLLGYGVNFLETWHRAAYFVDRILKGTKPNDLPVEQATTFEVVANMKTAKALGLTIPQPILLRADKVIE